VSTAPNILLLDEPFSNLDYRTARYLRLELKRIQRQLRITTLFVTHNLEEAQELGDQIGVLQDGRLEQRGRPGEIFLSPLEGSDRFLQRPNILTCSERKRLGNGLMEMTWAGRSIFVPDEGKPFDRVAIHPQHVYISRIPPPGPAINRFQAHIKAIREQKGYARILLNVDEESLEAEMSSENLATLNLRVGDPVVGILKLRALHGC
jgi:ABC-type Fe3+/spermidine/putrescine transport system ATPase subunit